MKTKCFIWSFVATLWDWVLVFLIVVAVFGIFGGSIYGLCYLTNWPLSACAVSVLVGLVASANFVVQWCDNYTSCRRGW